jgi:sugar O-acyltransferase (sialic acid O-acetyltransferase NeuD family)
MGRNLMQTTSFSIIESNDPIWKQVVSKCVKYDFYHTQAYHNLESDPENRSLLLVAYFNDALIAFPIIIRPIENTDYFDCTSVYGYAGAISNKKIKDLSQDHIDYFQKEVWQFFKNNKIVSAFSRLHPLIKNKKIFNNFGELIDLNNIVVIDLKNEEDTQKAYYRKSTSYDIKQLQKKGFVVTEAKTNEEIEAFISIYKQTMLRVNAREYYFFDEAYFKKTLSSEDYNSKLLIAKSNGVVCAGALFIVTNKIMQYHLAGTLNEFIKVSPMKLIIDEARKIGTSIQLDYLFLGGGQTKDENDTLYKFKSGFSNLNNRFQTWNLIVDINTYNKLVTEKNINTDSDYFPLYRATENENINTLLYGASGHAKVILDILKLKKRTVKGIFDNNPTVEELLKIPVYKSEELNNIKNPTDKIIIAIGDNELRKKKVEQLEEILFTTAIHPSAVVSSNVAIGEGSVIMATSIINTGAKIGKHVIINTGALIEHDCIIEDFAHVSPKAALAGNVTVKEGAQVGINSSVRQGITIGKWSIVGAGAVIVKDVPDYAVVVGNPGKIIKYTNE